MHNEAFLRLFAGDRRLWTGGSVPLEQLLRDALERARAPWPVLHVPDEAFLEYLGARVDPGASDPTRELAALHLPDLYLACGCALGLPAAVAAFVDSYLTDVPKHLARFQIPGNLVDDVQQELSQRFLVARPPEAPRIVTYSGRGPLRAWLAVAAQRSALRQLNSQGEKPAREPESLAQLFAASLSPELMLAKAHLCRDFQTAIRHALDQLSPRERMLLRLSVVGGLGSRKLAELYQVNHATAARWLVKIRHALLESVQAYLQRQGIDPADLTSMLGLARSQLEISFSGLLRDAPAESAIAGQ